jgi:hypothetical protein
MEETEEEVRLREGVPEDYHYPASEVPHLVWYVAPRTRVTVTDVG